MMNTFRKFLIFGICCVIFQRSYGRKWYSYEPYEGFSNSADESKFVEEKILNMHPQKSTSDESLQNTHLFKTNTVVSKEFQQTLPKSDNENHPSKLNSADLETLETQVGEHLIKVTSKKEPKNVNHASRGGEYDVSINPKYSHVIEIIHRRDDIEKLNKPTLTYDATIQKQAVELKIPDSEKIIETKWSENHNKFEVEENSEVDTDESDKSEEEFEADVDNTEESHEAGDGQRSEESDEKYTEEYDETEEDTKNFGYFDEDHKEYHETYGDTGEEFGDSDKGHEEYNETERDPEEFEVDHENNSVESEKTEVESEKIEDDVYNPEESFETERDKGFDESDEKYPEEYDEAEEDTKQCGEFDYYEEYHEPDGDTEEEFGDSDKDPEESNETEKFPDEFEADYEEDFFESDETEQEDEEFGEVNERGPEESEDDLEKSEVGIVFAEASEKNAEETDKGDVKGPETHEVDEGNIVESSETHEKNSEVFSDGIEDTTKFERANNSNSGMGNEQISNNKESPLNEEFEGSGEEFVDTTNDENTAKTGRILGVLSRRNETFPACTTQRGEAGHCRRLGECLLSEALSNFNGFLQQLCLIRGALVGICCPDNPVIETVNPDDNTTNELSAEEIEQPPEGCGLNTKTRIVGGSISVPHEWTWMVALMRRNRFYCGGVIINNWYILTAAHCVMGMNVKDLTVRLGEYDFNEQSKHTEDLSVSEIKRHAQFITLTFQHDIALLKLKQSIKYSKFVGSICLPEQKARDYSDVKGTVVGWGTVSFGGAASPILRQVTVPVWKNEDCDRTYLLENIGDSFMCAGSPEKGEDACQGDSGGPLMTVNENGRWEVIGLVSWGRRCGDPTYPGVYTRVTTYLDWIKQNAV